MNMKVPKNINNLKSCFKVYNKINEVTKKELRKRSLHISEDMHKDFKKNSKQIKPKLLKFRSRNKEDLKVVPKRISIK